MRRRVICVVALLGCDRGAANPPSIGSSAVAPPIVIDAGVGEPLIDLKDVVRCTASYTCGMSHPGLGTWSRSTTVDLSTCERTLASSSAEYDATPTPPSPTPADAPPKPAPVKLDTATCQRIAAAAAAVTRAEADHHESAPRDTAACSVALVCGDRTVYSVQRQTTQIVDHASALITALGG